MFDTSDPNYKRGIEHCRAALGPYQIRAARHLVGRRMQGRVITTPQWAQLVGVSAHAAARWERPMGSSHYRSPSDACLIRIFEILAEHGLVPNDCIREASRHADARRARVNNHV